MCMNKLICVIQYVTKYVISSHINTNDLNLYMETLKYFNYYLMKDIPSFTFNHIILSIQRTIIHLLISWHFSSSSAVKFP